MALFTMYWPDWMCAAAREQGLEGQPLDIVWGGHNHDTDFTRFKVGAGDTLVPVTCVEGVVYALASVLVQAKGTGAQWLASHPEHAKTRLPGCGNAVLAGTAQAPLRFDRALSAAQLTAFRYATATGERPLKFLRQGRLTRTMSMQGVYRVTEPTATMVTTLLSRPEPGAPARRLELEGRLREHPNDEPAARVLSDLLQEAGELQGELLALELELAHETNAAHAVELDRRHAALMRSTAALKRRPGGFPFRTMLGARGFSRLSTSWQPEELEGFFDLASHVLAFRGVTQLEVPQRSPRLEAQLRELGATATGPVWTRDPPLSLRELMPLFHHDRPPTLYARGPVRAVDGGERLPFQAASQWQGRPPFGLLRLVSPVLSHVGLRHQRLEVVVPLPDGSPLALAQLRSLTAEFKRANTKPVLEHFVRSVRGDRLA